MNWYLETANKTKQTKHIKCVREGVKKRDFLLLMMIFNQFTNQLTNDEILINFRWIYCNWFLIGMFVCLFVFYLIYLNQLFSLSPYCCYCCHYLNHQWLSHYHHHSVVVVVFYDQKIIFFPDFQIIIIMFL